MYKEIKSLERVYDHELKPENNDISFCIHFMLQVLLLTKQHPGVFTSLTDISEWDYIVKFWGPTLERLFYKPQLRLKWQELFGGHCTTDAEFD